MMPNRISYTLGLHGPSYLVDTACSSSMYALDAAYTAIRTGQCDAAIVGGSNLLLNPNSSLEFSRLGVLALDGYCRPFDNKASGYVRAEAICTILLQKKKDAKRIYAKVIHSKTNCDGFKMQGITWPSGPVQQKLLLEFYRELNVRPSSVNFVEAHSTGTVVGDPEECNSLDNVFCEHRNEPLLVGSVKSNIGHSESTSGMCSIAKIVLAFERGEVAPNINYNEPRNEIDALTSGRLKVCTEVTKLSGSLVAINSFGFGGANAHTLLDGNFKVKCNLGIPEDDLPRLVVWCGRTEESITTIFDAIQSKPLDAEFIGLLHNIQQIEEPGFIYRGYSVFKKNEINGENAISLASSSELYSGTKRPIVWMFSGMGSQWTQMGKSLLSISIFQEAVVRCQHILEPLGINVMSILTNPDPKDLNDIVNSFVGIAVIQIGLVDILRALQITPDYIVGHSVGELGCGYADGVLTTEQMVLGAYYRAIASKEASLIRGAMAAIGIGYKSIIPILPKDIEVACHNSANSCTISGPEQSVQKFVTELKSQQIMAKEVNTSHIAYHSKHVIEIGKLLHDYTKDLFPRMNRSPKWLSTSVPKDRWADPDCEFSCPMYYINNLLSSVLFEEIVELLPENSIVIEIAPHGLLQAIVRKSMPNAIHVPLTNRDHFNNAAFLLAGLGK